MTTNPSINPMKGKVYKIKNDDNDKIYVGSTFKTLEERWQKHLGRINEIFTPLYCLILELTPEAFNIELLEEYECKDRNELRKYEQEWIEKLKPQLNCRRAVLTLEERKKHYQEYMRKSLPHRRAYYQQNKERIKEREKKRQNNLDEDKKKKILERRRQLYHERRKEQYHSYYEKNKETILAKFSEIVVCECGDSLTKNHLSRHKQTKKHAKQMELINAMKSVTIS